MRSTHLQASHAVLKRIPASLASLVVQQKPSGDAPPAALLSRIRSRDGFGDRRLSRSPRAVIARRVRVQLAHHSSHLRSVKAADRPHGAGSSRVIYDGHLSQPRSRLIVNLQQERPAAEIVRIVTSRRLSQPLDQRKTSRRLATSRPGFDVHDVSNAEAIDNFPTAQRAPNLQPRRPATHKFPPRCSVLESSARTSFAARRGARARRQAQRRATRVAEVLYEADRSTAAKRRAPVTSYKHKRGNTSAIEFYKPVRRR